MGWFRALVATVGARFIYFLIWLFGRTHRRADLRWLEGPIGGDLIGDAPYQEVAAREGLTVERRSQAGGLVPDWTSLACAGFDPAGTHPQVREFYERTTEFAMDVWSKTYFPMNVGLWLLVTTISRQVNQLNFPLSSIDAALGMGSEIIMLRRPDGAVRYTGWFRTLGDPPRVLYTGFYMVERAATDGAPCVKVVFPMPRGNATVVLQPRTEPDGSFVLESGGGKFGGPGFYRVVERDADRLRVWHVRGMKERFRLYVDAAGFLRCDHTVRFLGLPVLRLHYKIVRRAAAASAA